MPGAIVPQIGWAEGVMTRGFGKRLSNTSTSDFFDFYRFLVVTWVRTWVRTNGRRTSTYAWIAPSAGQHVARHHYGTLMSMHSTFAGYSRLSLV